MNTENFENDFEDFSSARCILSQSKLSPNHTISGLKRLPQDEQQGSSETGIFAPGQSGSGAPKIPVVIPVWFLAYFF